jgi:hypothetical protein
MLAQSIVPGPSSAYRRPHHRQSHDGLHQFMVPDPAIIGAGRRAQFGAAAFGLQQFHLFAAMGDEAMLQVDPGKGGRKLAQIGGRRTDKAGQLAKPVGRGNRALVTRRHQHQAFGIVAFGLNPDRLSTMRVEARSARRRTLS